MFLNLRVTKVICLSRSFTRATSSRKEETLSSPNTEFLAEPSQPASKVLPPVESSQRASNSRCIDKWRALASSWRVLTCPNAAWRPRKRSRRKRKKTRVDQWWNNRSHSRWQRSAIWSRKSKIQNRWSLWEQRQAHPTQMTAKLMVSD